MVSISPQDKDKKKEHPLPTLRQDIKIYRGPDDADGSPTYNLYDPVRVQYFQISWTEAIILQNLRPGITLSQLTDRINKTATFKVTPDEVKNFLLDASRLNILATARASEEVLKEAQMRKRNPFVWFIYYYLYFRVPLINPDAFLARTLKYVTPLASRTAITIYTAITMMGLTQLVGRFDEFLHTFTYFFNFEGLFVYAVAIICIKLIHEFAHAYTAKYFGLHVPAMGAAFIVLWPVLYTDVTDGWKLRKRSERLAISFAGIAVELTIAGVATLGWAFSEPGLMQSVFFVVSSTTWISTLLINLNPAMRFDGYYILCDLSGIDNLQMRAFAFTRWQLRKWLLGLDVPAPEELITPKRRYGLVAYSIYTWLYRLTLYTTIAVFIYYKFTKSLGILLFLLEIGIFIIGPIISELRQLSAHYPNIKVNPRLATTMSIVGLLAVWFFMPFPHQEKFAAITAPYKEQVIYIPQDGIVKKIYGKLNAQTTPGQTLIELDSPQLNLTIEKGKSEAEIVKSQISVIELNPNDLSFLPEKESELASLDAKTQGLLYEKNQLMIKANISGTIYDWDNNLRVGETIAKNQIIGRIAPLDKINVVCYVPEILVNDLKIGDDVTFRIGSTFEDIPGKITEISPERAQALIYPQLASINKGPLPVSDEPQKNSHKLVLVESYFPVQISLVKDHTEEPLRIGEVGEIIIEGPWRSNFVTLLQHIQTIFWRESGI